MIEIIQSTLSNLDFSTFIFIVFFFFLSFSLAKLNYIRRRLGHDVEIDDRDNLHVIDKLFLVLGVILILSVILVGIDQIISFLQSYDILLVSLLMIGIPLLLVVVFISRFFKFLETEKSVRKITYNCFVELSRLVFYASFAALALPLILYLLNSLML